MSKKESACAGVQTQYIHILKMKRPPRPRQFDDPPLSLTPGTCGEAAGRRAQPAQWTSCPSSFTMWEGLTS